MKSQGRQIWEKALHQTIFSEDPKRLSHLGTLIANAIDELLEDIERDRLAEIEHMEEHYRHPD